ncbi:hypothetical protein DFH28DRAFT_1120701 [Melampsora americana]|nr:hypothetical protein DFH28DRAFT_1120701 [Melampsora americana]
MTGAREDHLKRSNELAQCRVEALEEGSRVIREMAKSDAEAKASLNQFDELKCLKEKYEAPDVSDAFTSNT